ncbi:MAG: trypsin-like peptidase domain-containing protein, partial [Rhodobacteraceae bacterium]|nr:trypsin-like peptidase domain-containing protein [Paracoccaceae bacterium]
MILRPFRLLALVLTLAANALNAQQVPESRAEIALSFSPVAKQAIPAVVNIYATRVVQQRLSPFAGDPFFERFFQPRTAPRLQNSLGSGVIVDPSGIVVSNHHVVGRATEIRVVLSDRREYAAEVLLTDEARDIAVLKVKADAPLPALELADSDRAEVGDLVLAIGNPFGVGQTVTSGIVSAVARTQVGLSDLNFFIQTDAAINPGNSGGALITMDGKLVGVNTAIFSKTGGSHGIGFAVPSNMVRFVLAGVAKGGVLVRPWLGAWGQPVTSELAESLGRAKPGGVLVNRVYPGGPADQGGLKQGDVILAVNDRAVPDPDALRFR